MPSSRADLPDVLARIIKAYDIRGVVPDELDPDLAREVGAAFVAVTGATQVVTAHDMRPSSPALAEAFADGATGQGADVVAAGLGSTDLLYFASGLLDCPGAMFTASHNPARYNGIKLCRAGAAPVGQDTGLAQIRDLITAGVPPRAADRPAGRVGSRDLLHDYAGYLRKLVDLTAIRPLTVVADAGNGMAGLTVPAVLAELPLTVIEMFFELDGTFPNHEANPIDAANLVDLQREVRRHGADVGLAFDGDADRCFLVDERGEVVSPSAVTGLIADRELTRRPGATVIYNLITSRAVPELVRARGGTAVRTRVGHSFIKAEMASTGAVFGGEHSGHFYFADFWRADSGLLAAMHVLAALGESDRPLSELLAPYQRYADSGEVNSTVADPAATLAAIRGRYAERPGVSFDELDGLTVDVGGGAWFNVRSSNTEPLVRLNVEAPTPEQMATLRDDVLATVRAATVPAEGPR